MAILQGSAKSSGAGGFYPKTIDQSLRFNDADLPHLFWEPNDTPDGGGQKFTISFWMKRADLDNYQTVYAARTAALAQSYWLIALAPNQLYIQGGYGANMNLTPTGFHRDPSAWYHIVVAADTTQATASNRVKLYINGEQVTSFSTETYPSQNADLGVLSTTIDQYIGRQAAQQYFDGYLTEFIIVDNQQLAPTDFGETKAGIWIPKEYSGTYGQGTHLDFANSASIGNDVSGNNHDWIPNNFTASDVVPDSPTNNFATLNSVEFVNNSGYLSEGNLKISDTSSANLTASGGTIGMKSGKWYWEAHLSVQENGFNIGVVKDTESVTSGTWNYTKTNFYAINGIGTSYVSDGAGAQNSAGTTFAQGDTVQVAYDADTGKLYFGKNGTWLNSADPAAGTGNLETTSNPEYGYHPATSTIGDSSGYSDVIMNFGQDDTFAGNLTAVGNTDGNGIGSFKYTVPSGYLALCTSNLPDPVIDPAQEATADQHFNVYTYTGNGGTQLIGDVVREIPDTYPISQSLRFEDGDSAYLNFTPTTTERKIWTFSAWVKRANITGTDQFIFSGNNASTQFSSFYITSDHRLGYYDYDGSFINNLKTSALLRDPSAWYHLVCSVDTTQATSTDRVKLYINGVQQTSFSTSSYPALNYATHMNLSSHPIKIGSQTGGTAFMDMYIAETHFVDGTAYDADTFGVFDADGLWRPIDPTVTYGTNGFHLDFADSADIGDDNSGNTNDFTVNNLVATDVVIDTPTNQFAVADPNEITNANCTLSEGNLRVNCGGGSGTIATFPMPSGKWYCEVKVNSASPTAMFLGIGDSERDPTDSRNNAVLLYYTGDVYVSGSDSGVNGTSYAVGDIIGMAFDGDTGAFYMYKNGTAMNSGNPLHTVSSGTWAFRFDTGSGSGGQNYSINFGQDATFQGLDTGSAGPYSDGNSVGEFYYQPPTDFLALCENNLIQYDDNPLESPDFVWIKNREAAWHHVLVDSVRGGSATLASSATDAEVDPGGRGYVESFNKNGFVVTGGASGDERTNDSGVDYVAWAWKAGGTGVSNTDGSITSTVSANTDAGFSIVSYTGTGSNGTVGHGLNSTAEMVIYKKLDSAGNWWTHHKDTTTNYYLLLNGTAAAANQTTLWPSEPSGSVFSVGTESSINGATGEFIAYCFHSVDGFSKVGSYEGNNSTDGTFVYTGFRPKWVLIKHADSTGNWTIFDAERSTYNLVDDQLLTNLSNAEKVQAGVDFLSNGFKLRVSGVADFNNTDTYIYYAIAEQPFKYSNAC